MKKTDRLYVSYYISKATLSMEEKTNDKYFSIERKKGRAALLCPICNRMSYFNIDYTSKITSTDSTGSRLYTSQEYANYCDFCGHKIYNNDVIDGGIAEAIEILNKKGYKTSYSCEGHYDEKHGVTSLPYILFNPSIGDITKNFNGINTYPWDVCVEKQMKQKEVNGVITIYKNEFEYRSKLYISEELATPNLIKVGTYLDKLLNIVDRLKPID